MLYKEALIEIQKEVTGKEYIMKRLREITSPSFTPLFSLHYLKQWLQQWSHLNTICQTKSVAGTREKGEHSVRR